jgi:hypothetical protein
MAASSTARQVIGAINGGISPSDTEKYLAKQPVYTNKALIWSGVDKGGRIGGQAAAAIGQGAREESYLIKGIARAQRTADGTPPGTPPTHAQIQDAITNAQTDAYAVADAVANWLRNNPTCGVTGVRFAELEHVGLEQTWDETDPKIRIASVQFQVRVRARI